MVKLGSDDIPPEIWLHIASYMHMVDIRRVATLNRTFAGLVAKDCEEQRSRLILNTNHTHYVHQYMLWKADWKTIACNIAKKMQERIKSNNAQQIKQIMFYSYQMPANGPLRSNFGYYSVSVMGTTRLLLVTGRLRSIYKQYKNVESLVFLHDSSTNWRGPQCFNYLNIGAMWTTWGANLRELIISVNANRLLGFIVPPEGAGIRLPRLEVMRLAYMRTFFSSDRPEAQCPGLDAVAHLYQSATTTLHTLELRFDEYAHCNPPMAEILLPPGVVYHKLRHFAFKMDVYIAARLDDELANVTRFVCDHSNTLRKLQLSWFPAVIESLVDNTPPTFLDRVNGLPPVNLSIRAPQGSRILDPTKDGESLRSLRHCVVALSMFYSTGGNALDWSYVSLLGNLRKLSLSWGSQVKLDDFARAAQYAPRILSLSIRHDTAGYRLQEGLQTDNLRPEILDALKQWRLKDLGFYEGRRDFVPTWWYLRHMVTLIPNVESFFGRGHMEPTSQPWDNSWVWRRNKYVDEAWDQ